jgi:hypothetical protein
VRLIRAAVLAAAVALACVIPPIVHFVSGPLGPGIGGFVAGLNLRCDFNGAAVLGVFEAIVFTLAASLLALAASIFSPGLLPSVHWTVALIGGLVAFLYVFWLGTMGAWAGGAMARRSEAERGAR